MLQTVHRLDVTGTYCPVPILLTAREMARLRVGDRLEVIGDDPGILEDMPAWCAEVGHRLERIERHEDRIHCLLVKGQTAPALP